MSVEGRGFRPNFAKFTTPSYQNSKLPRSWHPYECPMDPVPMLIQVSLRVHMSNHYGPQMVSCWSTIRPEVFSAWNSRFLGVWITWSLWMPQRKRPDTAYRPWHPYMPYRPSINPLHSADPVKPNPNPVSMSFSKWFSLCFSIIGGVIKAPF